MSVKHEVIIADDSDHEKVFAEIYCDDKFLALISQENGINNLIVELPGPNLDESLVTRQIALTDFITILGHAAKKLVGEEKS